MSNPHVPPSVSLHAFNCPKCRAYAKVTWYQMGKTAFIVRNGPPIGGSRAATPMQENVTVTSSYGVESGFYISTCSHCFKSLLWKDTEIAYPQVGLVGPPPAQDMPKDIAADYDEARSIADRSARGAAAILRLCLQKLCKALGQKGENINADIGSLVEKGLAAEVQEALDTLRIAGNSAVHPGELDLRDTPETVVALMGLLNFVVEAMITEPNKRKALFSKMPKGAKDAIAKRDSNE